MPRTKGVAAWIFQATPDKYDLKLALSKLDEDLWLARQRADDMAPGQRVYLWLTGADGGLVAAGKIVGPVETLPAPEWQLPYWRPSARLAASQPERRVRVRYEAMFPHAPLTRFLLARDPVLARQRPIGPTHVGTNFAVSADADDRLLSLMPASI